MPSPLTFYFDRNFGTRFPEVLRAAKAPFAVEYHHDAKNKFRFAQDAADDLWLAKVAAENWIVFSHDRKFHELLPEISAVKQYRAACFYLPGASVPLWEKLHYFMRGYDGIKSRIEVTAKPFIFNLSYAGRFSRVKIP